MFSVPTQIIVISNENVTSITSGFATMNIKEMGDRMDRTCATVPTTDEILKEEIKLDGQGIGDE